MEMRLYTVDVNQNDHGVTVWEGGWLKNHLKGGYHSWDDQGIFSDIVL